MVEYAIPVYGGEVTFEYSPVDTFGAMSLAIDVEGWAQTIGAHWLWRGEMDPEAYAQALQEAAHARPIFTALLAAIGPPWRQRLVWRHTARPLRVEIQDLSEVPPPGPDESFDEWINRHTGLAAWSPDLSVESPMRSVISKLADDRWITSRSAHHAIGDLGTFTSFDLDIDSAYDRLVNGKSSPKAESVMADPATVSATGVSTISFREYARILRAEARKYPRKESAQPIGTPGTNRRVSASHRFDLDLTQRLRSHARSQGGSVTDLAVAAATLAVAEWNTAYGRPPKVQRYNLAISQRGRIDEELRLHGGTQTSLLTICSRADEWDDPDRLLRQLASTRLERMSQGFDLILERTGRRLARALSVVPVNRRLRLIRQVSRPDTTMLLTSVGAAGGHTDDPTTTRTTGGIELEDTYSIGFAVVDTPVVMALSIVQGQTQIRILTNEEHMSKAELTQLTDLVAEKMAAYAG